LAAERLAQEGCGNMEWLEFGLRAAMQKDARSLVEGLLNDPALAVSKDRAFAGEKCYRNRSKVIETLFGKVELRRNYYYGAKSQAQGRLPLDDALGLIEGYSPGLARLMCRIAAEQSYELAGADLLAYAGISVDGRAIQRMASLMGPQMRGVRESQPEPEAPKPIPIMYASADGTGVPMMRSELEGKKGRQPDGSARTREVKLGCVFTQHVADAEGNPLRDPSSTTYLYRNLGKRRRLRPPTAPGSHPPRDGQRAKNGLPGRWSPLGLGAGPRQLPLRHLHPGLLPRLRTSRRTLHGTRRPRATRADTHRPMGQDDEEGRHWQNPAQGSEDHRLPRRCQ
jgi:hypothetical protein